MQKSKPPYARFKVSGNLVFTQGFTSTGVTPPNADMPSQIRGAFKRLGDALAEAGASLDSVVQLTVYLANLPDREKYLNEIFMELFPRNPPTRVTVQTVLPPGYGIEISAVAEKR